ncbi:MAG: hypothetical protein ACXAC2_04480 [Candidatus Kariarchaeaceae archaeon]|jgi:hypothetical protein
MPLKLSILLISFLLLIPSSYGLFSRIKTAEGDLGTGNPDDNILFMPISWCATIGSAAAESTNVIDGDTGTDEVLWRRNERPTDHIWLPQTGISLRSAVNNAWGPLNFKDDIIDNFPTTNFGDGDILVNPSDDTESTAEIQDLVQQCEDYWRTGANTGSGVLGMTAINVNLFHDGTNYLDLLGIGMCIGILFTCSSPYQGSIIVVDNEYTFIDPNGPVASRRQWPGTSTEFQYRDLYDIAVAHVFGHALGLEENTNDANRLMYGNPSSSNGIFYDNFIIEDPERTLSRESVLKETGHEVDPPGEFVPSNMFRIKVVDNLDENQVTYEDITKFEMVLNAETDELSIAVHISDLIPSTLENQITFWGFIDYIGGGADSSDLSNINAPQTQFTGADIITKVSLTGSESSINGEAWVYDITASELQVFSDASFELLTNYIYYYFANSDMESGKVPGELNHVVSIEIDQSNLNNIVQVNKEISVNAILVTNSSIDKLDPNSPIEGETVRFSAPEFAHCYPEEVTAIPGENLKINVEGLGEGIFHALLGPDLITTGDIVPNEEFTIDFLIPEETPLGLHLITIGKDGTALTADCVVDIEDTEADGIIDFAFIPIVVTLFLIPIIKKRNEKLNLDRSIR